MTAAPFRGWGDIPKWDPAPRCPSPRSAFLPLRGWSITLARDPATTSSAEVPSPVGSSSCFVREEGVSGAANRSRPHQLTVRGQMFLQLWESAAQNHDTLELCLCIAGPPEEVGNCVSSSGPYCRPAQLHDLEGELVWSRSGSYLELGSGFSLGLGSGLNLGLGSGLTLGLGSGFSLGLESGLSLGSVRSLTKERDSGCSEGRKQELWLRGRISSREQPEPV